MKLSDERLLKIVYGDDPLDAASVMAQELIAARKVVRRAKDLAALARTIAERRIELGLGNSGKRLDSLCFETRLALSKLEALDES